MNLLKIRDGATKLFFPDIIKAIMIEGEIVDLNDRLVKLKSRKSVITVEKPENIGTEELFPGKKVNLSVRPEKISIHQNKLNLSNVFSGVVSGSFFLGVEQKIKVETDDKFDLMVRVQETKGSRVFHQGERVKVGWGEEAGNIFF